MPIILKNVIVTPEELVKKQQPPQATVVKTIQTIHKQPKIEEETPIEDKYKHVKDGDLHKMINTKSDYLADMLDLT